MPDIWWMPHEWSLLILSLICQTWDYMDGLTSNPFSGHLHPVVLHFFRADMVGTDVCWREVQGGLSRVKPQIQSSQRCCARACCPKHPGSESTGPRVGGCALPQAGRLLLLPGSAALVRHLCLSGSTPALPTLRRPGLA